MFQLIDLRELAALQGPHLSFVSYYGSGLDGLKALHARQEQLRAMLHDEPDGGEAFEASMERLRNLLEDNPIHGEGVCAFSCAATNFVQGYPLSVAVPELLRVDSEPYIRPLAELQDEYENFLIVAADATSTRIIHVTSAEPESGEKVRGDVKNRVKKGGWSQQRYARRRENQLHHYAKEVAEVLNDLSRKQDFTRIILLGAQETLQEIESELSTEAAAKVVGRKSVNLKSDEETLIEEAYELYFSEERESEVRLWDRIREEFYQGGLAVAGATDVLEAVMMGRVDQMLITRDAKIPGVRCEECQNVRHGTPQTCQVCGSDSLVELDLVNEMVRQLELTSATAEFTDEISGLTKAGRIAALLRY